MSPKDVLVSSPSASSASVHIEQATIHIEVVVPTIEEEAVKEIEVTLPI